MGSGLDKDMQLWWQDTFINRHLLKLVKGFVKRRKSDFYMGTLKSSGD